MLGLRLRLGLGSAKVEVFQKYTNVYFFFINKIKPRELYCVFLSIVLVMTSKGDVFIVCCQQP